MSSYVGMTMVKKNRDKMIIKSSSQQRIHVTFYQPTLSATIFRGLMLGWRCEKNAFLT